MQKDEHKKEKQRRKTLVFMNVGRKRAWEQIEELIAEHPLQAEYRRIMGESRNVKDFVLKCDEEGLIPPVRLLHRITGKYSKTRYLPFVEKIEKLGEIKISDKDKKKFNLGIKTEVGTLLWVYGGFPQRMSAELCFVTECAIRMAVKRKVKEGLIDKSEVPRGGYRD